MFDKVKLTHIESLVIDLLEIPTVIFRLTPEELDIMIKVCDSLMDGQPITEDVNKGYTELTEKVDNLIKENFPDGCFIKLGSRSPKDSWLIRDLGTCCTNGSHAMRIMFDSERIVDDLYVAKANNYLPCIVLRKWIEIDPWREFRCFIKDGELVGISQYFYKDYYPEIVENKDAIENSVRAKLSAIRDILPDNSVIMDVVFNSDNTVTIIEFNPYDDLTDPCLFDWVIDKFVNFKFMYIAEKPEKRSCLTFDFLAE